MNFDPAITAWQVFTRVQASKELGEELEAAGCGLGVGLVICDSSSEPIRFWVSIE